MEKDQKLGDLLVEAGFVDEMQLRSALGHQKRWGGKLGKALVDLGFIEEDVMIKFLAEQFKMNAVNLARSRIAPQTFQMVPEDVARRHRVVPVVARGTGSKKTVVLAMSDPTNLGVIDEIQFLIGAKVEPVLATDSAISRVLASYGDYNPEASREIHYHEAVIPAQLRDMEEEKAAKEAAKKQREQPKPEQPQKTQTPEEDKLEIGDEDELEVVKGDVTMLKAQKPSRKTPPPEQPGPTTRQPEAPSRGREVILGEEEKQEKPQEKKSESPFLLKPEKEERQDMAPPPPPKQVSEQERSVPPDVEGPPSMEQAPEETPGPPGIEEPPLIEDLEPVTESQEHVGPPQAPEEGPQEPQPGQAEEKSWFVPPSPNQEALSDQSAEDEISPLELPDEEPGKIELADTHEFIPPAHAEQFIGGTEEQEEPEQAVPGPDSSAPPPQEEAPEIGREQTGMPPLPDDLANSPGAQPDVEPVQEQEAAAPPAAEDYEKPEARPETPAPPGEPDAGTQKGPDLEVPSLDFMGAGESVDHGPQQPEGPQETGPGPVEEQPGPAEKPPDLGIGDQGQQAPGQQPQAPAQDEIWSSPGASEESIWAAGESAEKPAAPDLPDLPPLPDLGAGSPLDEGPSPGPEQEEKPAPPTDTGEDYFSALGTDEGEGPSPLPFEAPPPDLGDEAPEQPQIPASDPKEEPPLDEAGQAQEFEPLTPEQPSPGYEVVESESLDYEPGEGFQSFQQAPGEPSVEEPAGPPLQTDQEERLPWEDMEQQREEQKQEEEKPPDEDPLYLMARVAAAPDESPGLEAAKEQIEKLEGLGEEYLDTKEVKKRLEQVAEMEHDIKEREYQFDELLNLMMKKEMGEVTQELFMKELQSLKQKVDRSREN